MDPNALTEVVTSDNPDEQAAADEAAKKKAADQVVVEEARKRYEASDRKDELNRPASREDLRMLAGDQWPAEIKKDRKDDERPCLTFPQQHQYVDQVIGDYRRNRPQIRVRCTAGADLKIEAHQASAAPPPGGGMPTMPPGGTAPPMPQPQGTLGAGPIPPGGQPQMPPAQPKAPRKYGYHEVMAGLIRGIEHESQAKIAYDSALESATRCGEGHYRVITQYVDDELFEQDIRIVEIQDPFSVHWDDAAVKYTREDAKFVFVESWVAKDEFTVAYPGAATDANALSGENAAGASSWFRAEQVRVTEYFRKVPQSHKLYLLPDGRIIRSDQEGFASIKDEIEAMQPKVRDVVVDTIEWYLLNGTDVLEGPIKWSGKYFPIISVWGKLGWNEGGHEDRRSVIRFSHDAQRMYNYHRTAHAEQVALQPKSPFIVVWKQIKNHLQFWNNANKKSLPFLPVDGEPNVPLPQRSPPPAASSGLLAETAHAQNDIRATIGMYQPSIGEKSNEKSGKAIIARQDAADTGSFPFIDNAGRSMEFCGRVLVDLIPRIMDTRRVKRIRQEDGEEDTVVLNDTITDSQTGQQVTTNDLSKARYEISVHIGPSFSTRKQESAEILVALMQSLGPERGGVIADLAVKGMDIPLAEDAAERLRRTLPPHITEPLPEGEARPPSPDLVLQNQISERESAVQMKEHEARIKEAEAKVIDAEARKVEAQARLAATDENIREAVARHVMEFMQAAQQLPPAPPPGTQQ